MTDSSEAKRSALPEQELANRLKEAREYLGISQGMVAQQLGIPRASVSALESGKRRVTSIELQRLARLYRTSVSQLLDEDESADPVERALFRTATTLSDEDRRQVLRFAEFLKAAGPYEELEGKQSLE